MSHWLGDAGICCRFIYSPASASLRHLGTPCLHFTSLMPRGCPLSHHRPSCSGQAGLSVPGTPRPFPPCPSVFAVASACLSPSSLSLSHAWSLLIILPALGTAEVIPDSIWKRAFSGVMIATVVIFFFNVLKFIFIYLFFDHALWYAGF